MRPQRISDRVRRLAEAVREAAGAGRSESAPAEERRLIGTGSGTGD
ncbi:MAG: hypothetical protein AB1Z65_03635 [Candidatus Sulfomarinibacteraceae bacterium]